MIGLPNFSEMPGNDEPIAVFATQSNHFKANGDASHRPFMPAAKFGKKTSCTRIYGMTPPEIWEWADDNIKNASATIDVICGRFDVAAQVVYENRLTFDPDNDPIRHANIDGWPDDRLKQKDRAIAIAAEAVFCCEVRAAGIVGYACQNRDSDEIVGSVEFGGKVVTFRAATVKELPDAMIQATSIQAL